MEVLLDNMGKGIHGNDECVRCGACCVYFLIDEPGAKPFGFKFSGTPCDYLEYNSETRKASCKTYDGRRPGCCKTFFCGDPRFPESEKEWLLLTLEQEKIFKRG
jgi:hypothetical protein